VVNLNGEIQQLVHAVMHSVMPLIVQKDGIIVYANEASYRVMRSDPAVSFVGLPLAQFLEPSEREEASRSIEAMIRKGEIVRSVAGTCIDGEGRSVRLVATVMPVQWQGGPAAAITFMSLHEEAEDGQMRKRTRRARSLESLGLSPREKQVATFVSQGFSVHNIAALLRIQRETVRTHIKSIYRKTSTHTRVELTRTMLGARAALPKAELSPR
jgi:DNA-binding CsgD family transcriptional regulator